LTSLESQQREYVADINAAGRHLLALINDILDLAKLQAGQLVLYRELVAVPMLIEEAIAEIAGEAAKRGVTILVETSQELPLLDGGDISLHSEPKRGSTFTLRLPLPSSVDVRDAEMVS